ncbi:MAG: sensor histidine kinase, partial [Stackebrandtia sp.]
DLDAAAVREAMTVIRENGVQGLTEMRAMIDLLRADGEPLPATPPRLSEVDALVERIGRPVRLDVSGDVATLPPAVDLAAYRIVQESLTNAAKHGGAGAVDVAIDRRDDEIELTVDSPLGDDRPSELPGAGAGLTGMRERATMLGGGFWAGATETGWRVHVVIPTTHKETA